MWRTSSSSGCSARSGSRQESQERITGLGLERRAAQPLTPYAQPMDLRPGFNLDKALRLAAAFEDEEIVRQLERRS